jgi:hypothetical protein
VPSRRTSKVVSIDSEGAGESSMESQEINELASADALLQELALPVGIH